MLDIQKTCKRRESLESIEDKHLQFEKNKINRADLEPATQKRQSKNEQARSLQNTKKQTILQGHQPQ